MADLKKFIKCVRNTRHPLSTFSRAAEPAFDAIISDEVTGNVRFRCQDSEPSNLKQLAGGSSELCAQLGRCEGPR